MKIYFDGGCRPNPGRMEVAAIAGGHLYRCADAGFGTSEQAEWMALLHALDVAQAMGERDIILLGDAMGVINQAVNGAKCGSSALRDCRERFGEAVRAFDRVRLRYVKRSQNLAGIALGQLRQGRRPIGMRKDERI
ncbi:MAG TPA: reverse transcriptase-like protein [Sphingomicrobium sp.]|nr:reverse transcriptase-like protein [Sphingomicrobium sp.]